MPAADLQSGVSFQTFFRMIVITYSFIYVSIMYVLMCKLVDVAICLLTVVHIFFFF